MKDETTAWTEYSAVIIKDDHPHQLDSNGSIQLFLYLDKDSFYGRQLIRKYLSGCSINNLRDSDIRKLSNDFFKKLVVAQDCESLFQGCVTILKHLVTIQEPSKRDDRVDKAIAYIVELHHQPFKIKSVADHVCLSESRLRHLFKEQVGQPIQNFILWMKVVDSLNLVLKGRRIDQAAQDTGFWDASHMSRSYKELLGITPGAIKQYENEIRIIPCRNKNLYTFKTEILNGWNPEEPHLTINTKTKL